MPHPIPDIPGEHVREPDAYMVEHFYNLCGLGDKRNPPFPGAQPVSFSRDSLKMLETMDFWVCEKSDGVRLLVFIIKNPYSGQQETWLVDRKRQWSRVDGLYFPHHEQPGEMVNETILDGELVIDIDPATGQQTLRYYAFDCLVVNGTNIMSSNIMSRYGRLLSWVMKPFQKELGVNPDRREYMPFDVVAKTQEKSYYVNKVQLVDIPKLHHGHDGLIFTCAESPYTIGTDQKILKWKPADENSIDFRLQLRFPPSKNDPHQPDLGAKPAFLLETWTGERDGSQFFDTMDVSDEQWEEIKESGEQWDGRIVEVCWDKARETWSFMRFRDDKPHANFIDITKKIIKSIEEGVELQTLLAKRSTFETAWRDRDAKKKLQGGAPLSASVQQQQRQPPPQAQAQAPRPVAPAAGGAVPLLRR